VTTGGLDKGSVALIESKELLNILAPLGLKQKQTVFAGVTNNRLLKRPHSAQDVWHRCGNRARPLRLRQGFDISQDASVKKNEYKATPNLLHNEYCFNDFKRECFFSSGK
jgi:hypothetical protein